MKKHTICLLNDSFPPQIDGVANVVVNYADIIEREYGHAMVVTPSVPGADDSGFSFPVLRFPSIDTRKQFGYVTGYPFSADVMIKVRKERAELLHLHCPATSALLARQLKETMALPLIMTYHTKYDIDIAKLVRSKLIQDSAIAALIQNVRACDEVWTVSHGAGENLRSLGYEGDYIVMENGVDLPRGRADEAVIEKAVSGYDLPADVPVYLFIGRLMWYKGIQIILDALAKLKIQGSPFRMVFIGDGQDRKEISEYAAEKGLAKVCFFTGALSDRETLRAWYSRADLFLFPSTFDTNGLVVREAAACSLPAILIEGSCASEGVTDGRNGFLIKENAASMLAKLKELSENPDVVRKVGECAGEELYLSWEEAVGRAADRYEIVIENYKCGKYTHKPGVHDLLSDIRSGQSAAKGKLIAAKTETQQRLQKGKDAFWEHLDRYL